MPNRKAPVLDRGKGCVPFAAGCWQVPKMSEVGFPPTVESRVISLPPNVREKPHEVVVLFPPQRAFSKSIWIRKCHVTTILGIRIWQCSISSIDSVNLNLKSKISPEIESSSLDQVRNDVVAMMDECCMMHHLCHRPPPASIHILFIVKQFFPLKYNNYIMGRSSSSAILTTKNCSGEHTLHTMHNYPMAVGHSVRIMDLHTNYDHVLDSTTKQTALFGWSDDMEAKYFIKSSFPPFISRWVRFALNPTFDTIWKIIHRLIDYACFDE